MTSKEALLDIQKRNEALKKEGHFHIGTLTIGVIEKLVERDTPVKVKKETYTNGFIKLWACSVCGSTFQKGFVYCPDCGQRLDWSE